MACNQQILGYSNVSASQACRNYYVNPTSFSLDGQLGDDPNLVLNKIIYQDNTCSVQGLSGWYSDGFVVRFYTPNNLQKSENCGKTNLFKYCCDGRLFNLENIGDFSGGLPQGISLYLTISNNINQFTGCFESVFEEGTPLDYNIVEYINGPYTNCQTCLSTNDPVCLLSAGTYEFKSCTTNDIKYFDITTNYLFYQGAVVEYSGSCYYLVSASTITPEFSFSAITYSGCGDSNCIPTPPPTPITSIYAIDCCGGKLYKLTSGQQRIVGDVYSLPPSDFCYTIISQPSVLPSNIDLLNDTNFILVDDCNSVGCQKCPDTPLTGQTANECEPITIFPLGLTCNVVNPTIENPFGGVLSLIITGGTSPYTVVWTPGGTGTTLYNQPAGTYVATVTDYWGDFVEKITCTLELPVICNFEGSITPFVPPISETYSLGRVFRADIRDRNYLIENILGLRSTLLTSKYWDSNEWWGDQGYTPQCVGYAWAHWIEDGPIKHGGTPPIIHPSLIYSEAQKLDEWIGENYEGTSVRGGAKYLKNTGKISSYLWTYDLSVLINTILTKGPVVVGTNWYMGMFYPNKNGLIKATGRLSGGHAYVINGVDLKTKLFRIKNSWGQSWGQKGFAYISFSDMQRLIRENGEVCLAIENNF